MPLQLVPGRISLDARTRRILMANSTSLPSPGTPRRGWGADGGATSVPDQALGVRRVQNDPCGRSSRGIAHRPCRRSRSPSAVPPAANAAPVVSQGEGRLVVATCWGCRARRSPTGRGERRRLRRNRRTVHLGRPLDATALEVLGLQASGWICSGPAASSNSARSDSMRRLAMMDRPSRSRALSARRPPWSGSERRRPAETSARREPGNRPDRDRRPVDVAGQHLGERRRAGSQRERDNSRSAVRRLRDLEPRHRGSAERSSARP